MRGRRRGGVTAVDLEKPGEERGKERGEYDMEGSFLFFCPRLRASCVYTLDGGASFLLLPPPFPCSFSRVSTSLIPSSSPYFTLSWWMQAAAGEGWYVQIILRNAQPEKEGEIVGGKEITKPKTDRNKCHVR